MPSFNSRTVSFSELELCQALIEKNQREATALAKTILIESAPKDMKVNAKLPSNVILDTILQGEIGMFFSFLSFLSAWFVFPFLNLSQGALSPLRDPHCRIGARGRPSAPEGSHG
jgi:hypothetical protein